MVWPGLAILILEVLVVVLRGDLPTLLVCLMIDSGGALVGVWIVKKGRRKAKPGELESSCSSLREEGMRSHFSLEKNESQAAMAGTCQNHGADGIRGDESTTQVLHLEREEAKDLEDDTKVLESLRQAGFTATESYQLCLLQRWYRKQEKDRASEKLSRLKFVRWLVETGKLTEQL